MNTLRETQPLQHIAGLAGGIQATIRQLEGLSSLIASLGATDGEEAESRSQHLVCAMGLFSHHLSAIDDVLDDLIGTAEDAAQDALRAV